VSWLLVPYFSIGGVAVLLLVGTYSLRRSQTAPQGSPARSVAVIGGPGCDPS